MARAKGDATDATEAPTPRRLADARRRGEVAYSGDLVGGAALAAAALTLALRGPASAARLVAYVGDALRAAPAGGPSGAAARRAAEVALDVAAAPLAAAFVAAVAVALLQTRGLVALGRLRPDARRLSPASALRGARQGDGGAARRTLGAVAKVAVAAALLAALARPLLAPVIGLAGAPAGVVWRALGVMARRMALAAAAVALLVGAADYLLARARHRRALRMTRAEVLRERRETEGDPERRAHLLRLRRERLAAPPPAEVVARAATLLVTGAAEALAVALRYQPGGATAPAVVAVGRRPVAAAMEGAARASGVPVVDDGALARALAGVVEGGEIPAALYPPVAAVIAAVMAAATVTPSRDRDANPAGAGPFGAPVG
jgi:type III secretion protein U